LTQQAFLSNIWLTQLSTIFKQLQAFKLSVAWTLFADFQLIIKFLNPNHERARADIASATIRNESFELIDASSAEGVQASTPRLNKTIPIWNFDGVSAQTNLVNRDK
jgi:hypothetical protein